MKKHLINLLPAAIILALPWTHKLFYENLMLAWPKTSPDSAHFLILFVGALVTIFFIMWRTR